MVKYIPARGDLVWLEFDPQRGREIQKTRPAVTVSPQKYNQKTGLALFMPITSQVKGYPFEVLLAIGEIKGAVLCDQVRCLDWQARHAKYIDQLPEQTLASILAKVALLIT